MLGCLVRNGIVDTNRSHADANTARDGTMRVVTFGTPPRGRVGDSNGIRPRIHHLLNGITEFELGKQEFPNYGDVESCQHPAWSPPGDRVSCSEAQSQEMIGLGYKAHLLYDFAETNEEQDYLVGFKELSEWFNNHEVRSQRTFVNQGLSFNPEPLIEMHSKECLECKRFTYKYAEWCGIDMFRVFTLFGDDDGAPPTVLRSWVYLVAQVNNVLSLKVNLTQLVSDAFFNGVQVNGMFSTCQVIK